MLRVISLSGSNALGKFLVSGIYPFLTNFAVYSILVWLGVLYTISSLIGSIIGIWVAFVVQKKWVFANRSEGTKTSKALPRHFLVYGAQILTSLSLLYLLVGILGIGPIFAFGLAAVIITPLTYIFQSSFTFSERDI